MYNEIVKIVSGEHEGKSGLVVSVVEIDEVIMDISVLLDGEIIRLSPDSVVPSTSVLARI
jgi:hypothetical protein